MCKSREVDGFLSSYSSTLWENFWVHVAIL